MRVAAQHRTPSRPRSPCARLFSLPNNDERLISLMRRVLRWSRTLLHQDTNHRHACCAADGRARTSSPIAGRRQASPTEPRADGGATARPNRARSRDTSSPSRRAFRAACRPAESFRIDRGSEVRDESGICADDPTRGCRVRRSSVAPGSETSARRYSGTQWPTTPRSAPGTRKKCWRMRLQPFGVAARAE